MQACVKESLSVVTLVMLMVLIAGLLVMGPGAHAGGSAENE